MISVIIPLYNAEKVVGRCLESVYASSYEDYEVIVVDDCSTDNSYEVAKRFPCSFIRLNKNSGPAYARNVGVDNSGGDILFFIDSDTVLDSRALGLIHETFEKERNAVAIIGLPEQRSLSHGLAPSYNALKNHYTLAVADKYSDYFTTQVGAVKREIFHKVGGFDTKFKGADIEDIEFGMRLPRGKTIIHKGVFIGHHFPDFISIARKYFRRSILLSKLVSKNKKMSGVHAFFPKSLLIFAALASLLSIPTLLLSLKFIIVPLGLFIIFFIGNLGLFYFISKERGFFFVVISVIFEYIFSIVIGVGGITGTIFNKNP